LSPRESLACARRFPNAICPLGKYSNNLLPFMASRPVLLSGWRLEAVRLATPATVDRARHMMTTGRPLRN